MNSMPFLSEIQFQLFSLGLKIPNHMTTYANVASLIYSPSNGVYILMMLSTIRFINFPLNIAFSSNGISSYWWYYIWLCVCVCVCQSIRCAAWRVADKFYVIRLIYFATMCQPVLIPNRIDIVSLQSDTIYLYGHNKNMSHAIDL